MLGSNLEHRHFLARSPTKSYEMLPKHSGCVFYWVFLVIPNSLDFLDCTKTSKTVKKNAVLEFDFQSFDHHRINCAFWGRPVWPLYWICLILWVWCSLLHFESYYIGDIVTFIRNWMEESHTFLVAFHVSIKIPFCKLCKDKYYLKLLFCISEYFGLYTFLLWYHNFWNFSLTISQLCQSF